MTEKTLAQKMFLHKAQAVAIVNADTGGAPLLAALGDVATVADGAPADWLLLFAPDQLTLHSLLPAAAARLLPGGALWVAYRKGSSAHATDINRDTIRAHAPTLGLDTVAIVAADADWSCLRLKRVAGASRA